MDLRSADTGLFLHTLIISRAPILAQYYLEKGFEHEDLIVVSPISAA